MKKICFLLLSALWAVTSSAQQQGYVVLSTPEVAVEYQVVAISPNAKWACGNINDGNYRGFIWNLVSGEVTELSSAGDITIAMDVSNQGEVVGLFNTTEGTPNNSPVETCGLWKEGRWTELATTEAEAEIVRGGMANCISADGTVIGGMSGNGFKPIVWKNGQLLQIDDVVGAVYGVSDDGQSVCGWTTHPEKYNRTAAIWRTTESGEYAEKVHTDLTSPYSAGPFCAARGFSPNGKYCIAYNRVYDMEQRQDAAVFEFGDFAGFEFYGVNNDGSVYGYYGESVAVADAVIKQLDGTTTNLRDLLQAKGVNLDKYPSLINVAAMSEDMNTIAAIAFDTLNIPRSLVFRLDIDTLHMAPVALDVRMLTGANACHLSWNAPLANRQNVKGYNVYRDGGLLNTAPVAVCRFMDKNVTPGAHDYVVKAVYADESESETGAAMSVTLETLPLLPPRNLQAIQASVNDVRLMWDAPHENLPNYNYYGANDQLGGLGGGTFNFEAAIRLRHEDLAVYAEKGYQLTGISFIPRSRQHTWTVALYEAGNMTPFHEETIPSELLKYGEENHFSFTNPLAIPEGVDVVMGVKVDVTGFGGYDVMGIAVRKADAGYSDLIRQEGQPEFFSMHEAGLEAEEGAYEYNLCWTMGMLLGQGENSMTLPASYTLKVNGTELARVEDTCYRHNGLADGTFAYEVTANYADQSSSQPALTSISVTRNEAAYKTIDPVVTTQGDAVRAEWTTPLDDDAHVITYASDHNTGGLVGAEADQFSYMVAAKYNAGKLRAFPGYRITAFRFYPLADADFSFILQKDGEEVAYQELKRSKDYVIGRWNTIPLQEPLDLDPYANYTLVLDCYDVTPNLAPVGMDDQISYPGMSDLYSTDDGDTFLSLYSQGGKNANWMIGMVVTDASPRELPLEGYKVYLNNELQHDGLLTETSFGISGLSEGIYQLRVNPVYGNGVGEKKSASTVFVIDLSAIETLKNTSVSLERHADLVQLTGARVQVMAAYSLNGVKVATSTDSTLSVAHLPAGVYVLKAQTDKGEVTVKLQKR